jgi:hypothetical protein
MPYACLMIRPALDSALVRLVGIAALLLGGLLILWCMARLDMTSAYYEGHTDAQAGIEAGWLPAWLPTSANRIQESHDIDTNESFAAFKFAPSEHFYSDCAPATSGTSLFPRSEDKGRFPKLVRHGLERIHQDRSLRFFRCVGRYPRSLAVDVESGMAYVWTDFPSGVGSDVTPPTSEARPNP